MGDDALAEFFGRYLSGALELYLSAKQGAQTIAPYAPFATLPFQATNALARLFSGVAPWTGEAAPPAAPEPAPETPTGTSPTTNDEIAALRREMAELRDAFRDRSKKRLSKIVRRSK
jgi:hypothetical protein